jgi:opacity protein-like surface antigen
VINVFVLSCEIIIPQFKFKNMKKLLLAFVLFAFASTVNAQNASTTKTGKPTRFSIGVEGAVPMGDFNDAGYNFGIGGSVQADHKVASELGLVLYAGYINHSANTVPKSHFSVIPVMGGIKYWFSPKVYAQGLLGAAFNSYKLSNTSGSNSVTSTGFAYSPGLGFMISNNIDFLVKYFGNSVGNGTFSSVGGRLAFSF